MKKILSRLNSKHLAAITFFVLLAGYAGYQMRVIASGPQVLVSAPTPSESVTDPLIEITGRASHIAHIYLNDTPIFTDEQGNFKEQLLLPPGYTILKLTAEDRFGRQVNRELPLVYVQNPIYQPIGINYGSKKVSP